MLKMRDIVLPILLVDEEARGNDNWLIYQVFKKQGWSTDLREIAKSKKNKFETIRRIRAKLQQENPALMPNETTTNKRRSKEQEIRKIMRGII